MTDPIVLSGSIGVGAVASAVAELLKGLHWIPANRRVVRLLVAFICLAMNAGAAYYNRTLDYATLIPTFLSYVTAVANYDHLFKRDS